MAVALLVALTLSGVDGAAQTDRRVALAGGSESGGHRTALVIGNGAYDTAPLRNPVNDATDVATTLRGLGFDVSLGTNLTEQQMEEAIRAFGRKLRGGGVGLFYFAGHGIQVDDRNYLIPVGARIESESDVEYLAVDAGWVLGHMGDAGNGFNIVILDACRDNPFGRGFRSGGQGLGQVKAPTGSLIAYATKPGSVAADGKGRNGTYTAALLAALRMPGLKVEDVFKEVLERVSKETGDAQIPWISTSLRGNFYFVPPEEAKPVAKAEPVVVDPKAVEVELWAAIRDSVDAADFEDYLKQYPNGIYTSVAKAKVKKLRPVAAALSPPEAKHVEVEPTLPATLGGDSNAPIPKHEPAPVLPAPTENSTAAPASAQPAVQGGARSFELGGGASVEMVLIEAGTFTMGSLAGDPDEKPIHRVTISRPYYLAKYEVTQEQWTAVMGTNRSRFKGLSRPIESVSWDEVQEFLRALNAKTGGGWRLPTEAEWEYACRAGTSAEFAGLLEQMGWYAKNSSLETHPVGQKQPNGWGLHDMHGNVWEWCQDLYGSYAQADQTDPAGATEGLARLIRGGGASFDASGCRSSNRSGKESGHGNANLGFRLARSPDAGGLAQLDKSTLVSSQPANLASGGIDNRMVQQPRILDLPRPDYTASARERRTGGYVVVRVRLGSNGRVMSAEVLQGLPNGLNKMAVEAAHKIKFEPAKNASGRPVDCIIEVSFYFDIKRQLQLFPGA